MDETELYIKMCDKATEIQERRDRLRLGDFVWRGPKYLYETCICEKVICYREDMVWLPRQDQLQYMINTDIPAGAFSLINRIHIFCYGQQPQVLKELFVIVDYVIQFKSMEQLWLAFVMKEKYNKVWNGEEWTIDRLYCDKHKHYLDETNDVCPECEGEAEQEALAVEAEWEAEQMAKAEDDARAAEEADRDAEQGGKGYYG